MPTRTLWSLVQFGALALWLGAATFLSVSVAPALFAVLPTRTLAGAVVGRLLPVILYSGIIIAVAVAAIDLQRGAWRWRNPATAAAAMLAACAIAQFVVSPRIERIRVAIAGPIDALPIDDPRRVSFGQLHAISVAWLGVAMLAALVALVLSVRGLRPEQH